MRSIEAFNAAMYTLSFILIMLRSPDDFFLLLVSASLGILAYVSCRTLPDIVIANGHVCKFMTVPTGLLVAAFGAEAISKHPLVWVPVALAYGIGNRLRAAGVGVPTR